MANKPPHRWPRADEQARRELLETVFVRFLVDGREVAKVKLRAPVSWLGALGESRSTAANDGVGEGALARRLSSGH